MGEQFEANAAFGALREQRTGRISFASRPGAHGDYKVAVLLRVGQGVSDILPLDWRRTRRPASDLAFRETDQAYKGAR